MTGRFADNYDEVLEAIMLRAVSLAVTGHNGVVSAATFAEAYLAHSEDHPPRLGSGAFDHTARRVLASVGGWAADAGRLATADDLVVALLLQGDPAALGLLVGAGLDLQQLDAVSRERSGLHGPVLVEPDIDVGLVVTNRSYPITGKALMSRAGGRRHIYCRPSLQRALAVVLRRHEAKVKPR
ncbi:MAG TPA: hypothetical protein VFN61_15675 [Acidimicrobiales bacterium]|nr:hypothetical protein [Acidimicrobiales bacterium]